MSYISNEQWAEVLKDIKPKEELTLEEFQERIEFSEKLKKVLREERTKC